MKKIKKGFYFLLLAIAILLVASSVLSIFTNTESRYLKMLDFPRIQFLIASISVMLLIFTFSKPWKWLKLTVVLLLAGSMVIQASYVLNYTVFVSKAVPSADTSLSSDNTISILLANIKMSNRNAEPFLKAVEEKKPDLIIVMEVDDWWDEQLKPIEQQYPYSKKSINEVAYGMSLYSKNSLEMFNVNYLNNAKVPSFQSRILLESGETIMLYSMHPVPPTHFEELPDNEGQKELAMIKLGEKINDDNLPTIVAGDFNDVSWGFTNRLTDTYSLLKDVRVGRGFYNSYDANSFFMRWPLDHIFVTKEFGVIELERLESIGSDHFPIYAKLSLSN